ncbi:MAG TPA: hypothetical protein V6D19_13095 [Stenomitos sp.]
MTNLSLVRAKVVEANPEIMELKFGCEVRHFLKGTAIILAVQKLIGESDCYDLAYYKLPDPIFERSPFNPNWDILGRPIRLADVLVAIENIKNDDVYHNALLSLCEGDEVGNTDKLWNLRKDSLDEQSEECILFLKELLVK